jgi:tetratricopeptide (TPR) repeat protein
LLLLHLLMIVMACFGPPSAWGQPLSARTLSGEELLRIGEIHDVQNHFPEALTYYDQALSSFRAHKQRKGEAVVLTKIAAIFERQGRRQEAAVQIRQALTQFSKTPDSPVHADALFLSARLSLWLGAREEAAVLLEQAREQYRRSKNVQALGSVTLQAGLLKVSDDSPDEGLREIQQVLDDARARRDYEQTLAALVALGDANWILDRTDRAITHYEQSIALLEQRPQATVEAGLRIRSAALSSVNGREEQGIDSAKRAVTLSQSLRDVSREAAAWTLLGSLHATLGHDLDAEDALQRALVIYRQQALVVHAVRSTSPSSATSPKESRLPALP